MSGRMEPSQGLRLPSERIDEIRGWINILNDTDSKTFAEVRRACEGLCSCGVQRSGSTHEATAAADLGVIESLLRALKSTCSAERAGLLFLTIFMIMNGNSKVTGIVEEQAQELIPIVKEYGSTYEGKAAFMDSLCLVIEQLASHRSAAPQLQSMIPVLNTWMCRPGARDRDVMVATCVLANFACTAVTFGNRSLWRALDRHLDTEFLTSLATSEALGLRKGQTETILLAMYGEIEDHPCVRALTAHGVMQSFVLPVLQHAYARTHWVERNYYFDPSHFFILRCISRPSSLARCLVEGGVANLAAALVAQPEREEDADVLELVWQGKTSALIGLANLTGHAELRRAVQKAAEELPLKALSRHQHAPLRTAAARLAFELQE